MIEEYKLFCTTPVTLFERLSFKLQKSRICDFENGTDFEWMENESLGSQMELESISFRN